MRYRSYVLVVMALIFTAVAVCAQEKVEADKPAAADAGRLADLAARAKKVVEMFSDDAAAYVPGGKYVVFTSNRTGLSQLYRTSMDHLGDPPVRLTQSNERVRGAVPLPDGKSVLYLQDEGANERWSIFKVGIDGGEPVQLTEKGLQCDEPRLPAKKPGMIYFACRSDKAPGAALYSLSLNGGEARKIYGSPSQGWVSDVSDDGRWVLWGRLLSLSSVKLLLIDTESGAEKVIYPAEGKTAFFLLGGFTPGDKAIQLPTDDGGEQAVILILGLDGKEISRYVENNPKTAGFGGFDISPNGKILAVTLTAGDQKKIRLFDRTSMKPLRDVDLPIGAGALTSFSPDEKHFLATWSSPARPASIFQVDINSGKASELLDQKRPGLDELPEVSTESLTVEAKDGLKLPILVHRPVANKGKMPVIVFFHGGPASSATAQWNPMVRFFTSLGYAYVEPNIRGSLGFGREYEAADNYKNRPKVFDDQRSIGTWIGKQPWADAKRLIVAGGSYGGYMSLNGITRQPDLWAACIDMYGPADLRTLLKSTSGPMREGFYAEFGKLGEDDDFLASVSPITQIDYIADPLFVYAGANDPRVPITESNAIVAAARKKGVPVEYMVAANEGHGLTRRENQIEFYSRVALFLDRHVINKRARKD